MNSYIMRDIVIIDFVNEGLEFCWDEKPSGDYLDTVKVLCQKLP